MPINLELKINVKSHQIFRKKLKKIGAKTIGILNQKDVYYKVPKGLLKLRIENEKESLIFYSRDEARKNRWSNYDILKIENGGSEKFLRKIFAIEIVVEKIRELFYFENTRIHLDKVKSLGYYLELETLVLQSKAEAMIRFDRIRNLLDLDILKQIKKSYRDLLMQKKITL